MIVIRLAEDDGATVGMPADVLLSRGHTERRCELRGTWRKGGAPVKAVRFDEYGEVDVLKVVDVPKPAPGPGQVLVQVKAAGINPGEAKIRVGLLHARWPATFPSGQGSDLAGVVAETGPGVTGFAAGDEVIGWTDNRASQAEYVVVEEQNLTAKPAGVPWEVAGALFVAGATAYAAVRAVALTEGDTVVVSGAAGGVGSLAVQLARRAGATVIGLASQANHEWLAGHGVIPVAYGDGVADRIRQAAGKVDAFIDTFGADYVQLALELGVEPSRIDTIARFDAVAEYGVKAEASAAGASASVLAELAGLIADGQLEVPIAATFPLSQVQDAYRRLAERPHPREDRPDCRERWPVGAYCRDMGVDAAVVPARRGALPRHAAAAAHLRRAVPAARPGPARRAGAPPVRRDRDPQGPRDRHRRRAFAVRDRLHRHPAPGRPARRRPVRHRHRRHPAVPAARARRDAAVPAGRGRACSPRSQSTRRSAEPAVRVVQAAFREYLDALTEWGGAVVRLEDLPDEPTLLSFIIAAAMVIDLPERQALLAESDTLRRLALQRALLSRETAMLRTTTSRPAPDLRHTPYSPN